MNSALMFATALQYSESGQSLNPINLRAYANMRKRISTSKGSRSRRRGTEELQRRRRYEGKEDRRGEEEQEVKRREGTRRGKRLRKGK